eukprot:4957866-Pyramimonas_sp.AAC.1
MQYNLNAVRWSMSVFGSGSAVQSRCLWACSHAPPCPLLPCPDVSTALTDLAAQPHVGDPLRLIQFAALERCSAMPTMADFAKLEAGYLIYDMALSLHDVEVAELSCICNDRFCFGAPREISGPPLPSWE